jgi:hypothetical protein
MTTIKQKLIYLASPYSSPKQEIMDYREDLVTSIAAALTEKYGYSMFLPITQSAPMTRANPNLDGKFDTWKEIDLFMIKEKSDEVWVVLMDGWRESVGVQAEIKCAEDNNIPLKFFCPFEMRFL